MKSKFKILVLPLIIIPSILFFICSKNESGNIQIIEEDGITIVSNPEYPLYPDTELILEEEFCIGEDDVDTNSMFYRRNDVEVDEDENIYVLDSGNFKVKIFDSTGKFLYSFGRKGQGPGEFLGRLQFCMDSNENIVVSDSENRRFTFFTKTGGRLKEVTFTEKFPISLSIDQVGNFYFTHTVRNESDDITNLNIARYDSNRTLLADFGNFPSSKDQIIRHEKSTLYLYLPFDPKPVWIVNQTGNLYFGFSDKYQINIFLDSDKPFKRIEKVWNPIEITQKEIEEQKQRYPKTFANDIIFPDHRPAFSKFLLDDNQNLWMEILANSDEKSYLFDIFDPEGKYISQVTLPFSPHLFKNGKIYTLESTEDEVELVKRYKYSWKNAG